FRKELSSYKGAKASVQFPLDKTLPLNLISKIVKYRVKKNLQRAETTKKNNQSIIKMDNHMQKITPFLWFDKEAGEAAKFYTSVFSAQPGSVSGGKGSKIKDVTTIENTPS